MSNATTFTTQKRFTGLVAVLALTLSFMVTGEAQAMTNPFFQVRESDSSDLSAFTKWTAIMPRYEAQQAAQRCKGTSCMSAKWESLLSYLQSKSLEEQVEGVNQFFNGMRYVPDSKNFGTDDYWQTPYELMSRGGDCEDYAIAKYISLKRLGVPESAMRIMIVRDMKLGGVIHAVLEVTMNGEPYLLDNQAANVKAEATVFHYRPVFAINEQKWWAFQA